MTQKIKLYAWINHRNLGDELSAYLIYQITRQQPKMVKANSLNKFDAIGSIITDETLYSGDQIWGSGLLDDWTLKPRRFSLFPVTYAFNRFFIHYFPKFSHICALRGPLSRKAILSSFYPKDLTVPEIFGDPGLLLPYVYQPKSCQKKYRAGIVLHQIHPVEPLQAALAALQQHNSQFDDICIINITRQGNDQIEAFIDELNQCEHILSTSLHGIILGQAYGIPTAFIQNIGQPLQDNSLFKFHDYFLGTEQEAVMPYQFKDYQELLSYLDQIEYHTLSQDKLFALCRKLMAAFPYQNLLTTNIKKLFEL